MHISRLLSNNRNKQRGIATIEAAIVLPLLVLFLLILFDFGRVMYAAVTTTNAARAGAGYGAQHVGTIIDAAGIKTAALQDATDLPVDASNAESVIVSSQRICRCAGSTSNVSCETLPCSGDIEQYVEVTANRTFTTLVPYPGIPEEIEITRSATMSCKVIWLFV